MRDFSLGGFSFSTREILQADLKNIRTIENAANIAAVDPLVLGAVQVNGTNVLLAGRGIFLTIGDQTLVEDKRQHAGTG